jgi:hypothetical protein
LTAFVFFSLNLERMLGSMYAAVWLYRSPWPRAMLATHASAATTTKRLTSLSMTLRRAVLSSGECAGTSRGWSVSLERCSSAVTRSFHFLEACMHAGLTVS